MPGYLALQYYDRINATIGDMTDLPVYDQMQDNFKTGFEEMGGVFAVLP